MEQKNEKISYLTNKKKKRTGNISVIHNSRLDKKVYITMLFVKSVESTYQRNRRICSNKFYSLLGY